MTGATQQLAPPDREARSGPIEPSSQREVQVGAPSLVLSMVGRPDSAAQRTDAADWRSPGR
jgi:hypothetical protein